MTKVKFWNALGRMPSRLLKWLLPTRFVLYGHLISDSTECMASQRYRYPNYAEFNDFRSLVEKLDYRFVTLHEYLARTYPRMILLTFDDGFIELLEFHRRTALPFVLFFVSNALDNPKFGLNVFQPKPKSFLSREDIIELKQGGVIIGYHTRSHKVISTLADIVGEIDPPDHHKNLMSSPRCFAYPVAAPIDYAPITAALHAAGYEFVFDTKSRTDLDGRHIFRISMDCLKTDNLDNPILTNLLKAKLYALRSRFSGKL
jgi:hypothetical protein